MIEAVIGAVILAAGSSKRFNNDKREAILSNGNTLLKQCIYNVSTHFDEVIVVLRQDEVALKAILENEFSATKLQCHNATNSSLGMGHSIASMFTAIPNWQGAMVFLADMPQISSNTVTSLLAQASQSSKHSIFQPRFNNKPGHPVLFMAEHFDQLKTLTGDQGAKAVIESNREQLMYVDVEDAGIHFDIDTQQALELARHQK